MKTLSWLHSTLSFAGKAVWVLLFLTSMLFDRIEGLVMVAVAAIFLAFPGVGANWFEKVETILGRLARRRLVCVVAVGLLVVVVRLALLPILPIPAPIVHDEFSYLFAADTFASGRLTNPTHPMWVHFETFHVSWQPTAFSKYFPGQGLFMAFGQVIFGHPWYGVVLSVGVMCGAVLWMLQQWTPPGWALLGASLLAIRMGITSYWMNSYWGGAVAAIGGALVWGALPGALRGRHARYGVILGIGLIVLASSRPLEGVLVSLPAAAVLAMRLFRLQQGRRKAWLLRSAAPIAALLAVGAMAMTYYNWRLTGDPLMLPHRAHDSQYATTGYSLLTLFLDREEPPEKTYNHKVLRDFYVGYVYDKIEQWGSATGFLPHRLTNFYAGLMLFVAPVFLIPMAALPRLAGDRRMLVPAITATLVILVMNLQVNPQPHYAAPVLALLCLLGVRCAGYLRHWTDAGNPVGLALVRAMVLICPLGLIVCAASAGLGSDREFEVHDRCLITYQDQPMVERQRIESELESRGGRHLVIVRYSDDHDVLQDWVYNRADIDAAPVIWAREMGPERNQKLIDYFRERDVWLVEPDSETVTLTPYSEGPE